MTPDELALDFAAALRAAGVPVSLDESMTFLEALALLGFTGRREVYGAGQATLVKRAEHRAVYDRVFDEFWGGRSPTPTSGFRAATPDPAAADDDDGTQPHGRDTAPLEQFVSVVDDDDDDDEERHDDGSALHDDAPATEVQRARASTIEVLRRKDFAAYTDAERIEARRVLLDLQVLGAPRNARRRKPQRPHRRGPVDLSRTMRDARRHDGEVLVWRTTRATTRPRPVVMLLDVSGSMEPYARAMLRLAHVSVGHRDRTRVEVFTLGTRLTRITRELSGHDADGALVRAAAAVDDWAGGTRLGENLGRFNDRWGCRGMARGATVVIVSDGWERGDPELLAEQMQRLARVAFRVVWVNPLKASPGYEPIARGMAAAMPHIDRFVEGHSLDALDELVSLIAAGPGATR